MRDSASEIPAPPVIVHLVRKYYSLDPPGTEGPSMETTESTVIDLRVPSSSSASKKRKVTRPTTNQQTEDPEDSDFSSASTKRKVTRPTTKRKAEDPEDSDFSGSNVEIQSDRPPPVLRRRGSQHVEIVNHPMDIFEMPHPWTFYADILPERIYFPVCPENYKPSEFIRPNDIFYNPPSKKIRKMSDLWALLVFMLEGEHCLTILSRPVFDKKNKRVFRQIGLMLIPEISQRRGQRVRIDVFWLEGSYEGQMVAKKCIEMYYLAVSYSREIVLTENCECLFFDPNPFSLKNWSKKYYELLSPASTGVAPYIKVPEIVDVEREEMEDLESGVVDVEREDLARRREELEFQDLAQIEELARNTSIGLLCHGPAEFAEVFTALNSSVLDTNSELDRAQDNEQPNDDTTSPNHNFRGEETSLPNEAIATTPKDKETESVPEESIPEEKAQESTTATIPQNKQSSGAKLQPTRSSSRVRTKKLNPPKWTCQVQGMTCLNKATMAFMGAPYPTHCKEHVQSGQIIWKRTPLKKNQHRLRQEALD